MKIIDILNKKANGTLEDGFKFCYRNRVFTYNKNKDSIYYENSTRELGEQYKIERILNDEVLLFQEEVKEAEKREENKEIEELGENIYIKITENFNIIDVLNDTRDDLKAHERKINELIRVYNKLIKEREEK